MTLKCILSNTKRALLNEEQFVFPTQITSATALSHSQGAAYKGPFHFGSVNKAWALHPSWVPALSHLSLWCSEELNFFAPKEFVLLIYSEERFVHLHFGIADLLSACCWKCVIASRDHCSLADVGPSPTNMDYVKSWLWVDEDMLITPQWASFCSPAGRGKQSVYGRS